MEGRNSVELANLLDKVTENDPSRVVQFGRDVEGLLGHPGWTVVEDLLTSLRHRGMDDLLRGQKPLEQAAYTQKLGFLNGVNTALDAVATVLDSAAKARKFLDDSAARQAAEVG
jgi:hypothetical protein